MTTYVCCIQRYSFLVNCAVMSYLIIHTCTCIVLLCVYVWLYKIIVILCILFISLTSTMFVNTSNCPSQHYIHHSQTMVAIFMTSHPPPLRAIHFLPPSYISYCCQDCGSKCSSYSWSITMEVTWPHTSHYQHT